MIEQGTRGDANRIVWQEPSYELTASGGLKKTITGSGNHADCQALIDPLGQDGWDVTVTPIAGGPRSTITANIISCIAAIGSTPGIGSGGNPEISIQVTWEVDNQFSYVDAADSTAFKRYLNNFTTGTAQIVVSLRIHEAAKEMATKFTHVLYDGLPNATEKGFAYDIAAGASVLQNQPVLRRTAVYPRTSTTRYPDWDNAGYVFTTAQLDAYTDAPNAILGTLPADATWLMIPDTLVYESDGRVTISGHWLFGLYPVHQNPPKI